MTIENNPSLPLDLVGLIFKYRMAVGRDRCQTYEMTILFKHAAEGFVSGWSQGWKYLKESFSRSGWSMFVPTYGLFCGPDYGDNRIGQPGIDDFDTNACGKHDRDMADNKKGNLGLLNKIGGDAMLIWRSFLNGSGVHIVDIAFAGRPGLGANYKFMLLGGFSARIVFNGARIVF